MLNLLYNPRFLPFLTGWLADRIFGDPVSLPHPVIYFGKAISAGEKILNKGDNRREKGAFLAITLILATFGLTLAILYIANMFSSVLVYIITAIGVFFCLAGKTLINEVRMVFEAVDRSTEEGRMQVGRIVGRDTANLSPQEIRAAALETLAENLSDGVIAPMFWFLIFGLPGMMAYKMVNTLDSMIGYKNERYIKFGTAAALIDDVANYIPARITAIFMLLVSGNISKWKFVKEFGPAHASPNSGYPEAALAAILNCRFGGTHDYFGKPVYKPYIGTHEREFSTIDMIVAVRVNERTELFMGIIICLLSFL